MLQRRAASQQNGEGGSAPHEATAAGGCLSPLQTKSTPRSGNRRSTRSSSPQQTRARAGSQALDPGRWGLGSRTVAPTSPKPAVCGTSTSSYHVSDCVAWGPVLAREFCVLCSGSSSRSTLPDRRANTRNAAAPNCAGTQPLAGNRRVTPLLRDSSGPFVAARVLLLTRQSSIWIHWLLIYCCF